MSAAGARAAAAAPSLNAPPGAALRAAFAAPLRAEAIAAASGAAFTVDAVEVALETGSTNTDLLAQARQQAPLAPRLRAALLQTAGRGRFGRRWHAAPGAALLFSVAVPLRQAMAPAASTLAVGVALAEQLDRALGIAPPSAGAVRVKWPNDLLLDDGKLGGVLAELAVDRTGARTLVVGVGINLWLDAAARGSIGRPAAALAARLALETLALQREALIGAAAAAVLQAVRDCGAQGFVPFQPRFMRRFVLLNAAVEIIEQGACVARGRVLGVDGEGRLLLDRDGRITAFASGEVSLRAGVASVAATGGAP